MNSSANRNSSVVIQVADNGPGIEPKHLPHIFDRFYQADDSNTRRGEGTGIGLALARELVRAMGGTVEIESKVGKGAKFSIRLPVEQTATKSDEAPLPAGLEEVYTEDEAGAIPQVQPNDRYSVLLVEDNPDVIAYLSSVLQLHYRIETARNGQEGIYKALELVPDVIVSDVMMPELCKALNMSRSNLFRKLKALTGKSVTVFIRTMRLEKARELLETTDMNVSEVCFAVGFNSPNYFSRVFQEEFGLAPSGLRRG